MKITSVTGLTLKRFNKVQSSKFFSHRKISGLKTELANGQMQAKFQN